MRNPPAAGLGHRLPRLSFVLAMGLSAMVVGAPVHADTESDPTRPTSNRTGSGSGSGSGGSQSHRVALGVVNKDDRSMADLDAVIAMIGGNAPAMAIIKSAWGDESTRDFPTQTAQAMASRGITPMIWWTPNGNDTDYYARHKNINLGLHDAYIRAYARDARQYGGQVLLRFAHEINNNYFPWSINSFDNTPESFIAAWRRVHGIFQDEGADNVRFVWSVAKERCDGGCNPYARVYPGDQYVDVMGFSGYNWGDMRTWTSMYMTYERPARLLREISGKPIIVAESGSSETGGNKAEWIRLGFREVHERLPQITGIVWTNVDLRDIGHPDWRINSSPAARDAYAEIAALDIFKAPSPFSSARTKVTAAVDKADKKAARKRAEQQAETRRRQAEADRRGPRVVKGSAASDDDRPAAALKGRKSRKTKSPAVDQEPVDTLDPFAR